MKKKKESGPETRYLNISCDSITQSSGPDAHDFKRFFETYRQELCNYLRSRYGGDTFDPEDVAQAAFVKLAQVKNSEKIINPKAFLFATARNIAIDEFRKAKIRLAHRQDALQSPDEEFFDVFSPETVLSERQELELMGTVIKKLPKIQRAVLLLHRLDKLTYSQIASKFGLSETTVRRHIANAMEKIHKEMKQCGISERY